MEKVKFVLILLFDLAINFGVLALSYPIWWEFTYQRYPASYWWGVYFWAAMLGTTVVSILAIVVFATLKNQGRNVLMFTEMFFSLVALSAISVLGGTSGPDALASWYPLADIDAKFFSELQILRFIPLCATSMAIVSGLLLRLAVLHRRAVLQTAHE